MRTLIIGGGIGGMTLAALLGQRGERPVIVERSRDYEHMGYMLGLYPMGSRVLHGLHLYERFLTVSEPLEVYDVRNGRGEHVKRFDIGELTRRFGDYQLVARGDLMNLLLEGARELSGGDLDLRMGTTVTSLVQDGGDVAVAFSDGREERFDLVVGADGMHSQVRKHLFGEVPYVETGWGGWLWWAPAEAAEHDVATEYWGAGLFVGVYPTKGRVGVFAGGANPPEAELADHRGRRERMRQRFGVLGGGVRALLDAIPGDDEEIFYWNLHDVRAPALVAGRAVLIGDAGIGFLPTAGVGASMAMESAAALADELSRTDARFVPHALELYVKRHARRVFAAQENSRRLGKLMTVNTLPLAWGRDQLMKLMTLDSLIRDIQKELDEPI
jgi:2-polyprenyl-6-methoxyphenol hydroxylase-like FAD-dependent oxidoreductase